ncbi:MAG: PQQ-binding-like beta-propeller repeat protein [Planctomycetes bacterium]|nr:PQQ-binding-like beta-propeller repeat protein [Planctomycetota bacterium]
MTAGRVPVQPLRNCPAVDDLGRLVACVQDELVMLSESGDGNLVVEWRLPTGGFIPGSPTISADGLIRVHSLSGCVYCVRHDGDLAWEPVTAGEPLGWATPLVDAAGNTWISAYSGGLIRISTQGVLDSRQYYRCASKLDSIGVIHNQTLFIGAEDQCVHAIDLSQSRGVNRWDHSAGRGRTGWYINSPLMMIDGPLIVAISRDDQLYAFHLDGRETWKFQLPGQVLGSPVATVDRRLYFGAAVGHDDSRTGCLCCLDTRTQQIVWRYNTAAPVESTPVLGNDGVVYFGDNDGIVHAIDKGGDPVWTEQLPSAIRSAAAFLPNGRVVFGSDDGSLTALRCEATGLAAGWPKQMANSQNSAIISMDG